MVNIKNLLIFCEGERRNGPFRQEGRASDCKTKEGEVRPSLVYGYPWLLKELCHYHPLTGRSLGRGKRI